MKENLGKIETALYQIHSIAKILEKKATDNPEKAGPNNSYSSEYLTLSQIISEKAELCLDTIDEMGCRK